MFEHLDTVKPALKRLVAELDGRYRYASVFAAMDDARTWRLNRSGPSISTDSITGGSGYCVRVFDDTGCCEYAFNEFDESMIPAIVKTIGERMAAQKAELPEGVTPLPTPIPADEPCVLKKATEYKIHPRELGDEAILAKLNEVREKGMAHEGILDFNAIALYYSYRELFLSKNRDLDQTCMYTDYALVALAARGDKIKDYYVPCSICGGAEVFDTIEEKIGIAAETAVKLLDAEPIPPGEYDCVCAPSVTGMIVHEAFGHGVEEDMFVKDRAKAMEYVGKRVASDLVTMIDGPSGNQTATFFFDHEGTLAQDTLVIDKGILVSGYADNLSAGRLGVAPTGNGRRENYAHKAYTRMTNTYFKGGDSTLDEMIASIDYGFLLDNPTSGMEDPKNWGIQCMVSNAYEIKDGKLTGKIYSPIVLTGYVPDLLMSISMMGKDVELCGTGYCGKGHKEHVVVSDGGPYMKARIKLG
jgi:TldD protein